MIKFKDDPKYIIWQVIQCTTQTWFKSLPSCIFNIWIHTFQANMTFTKKKLPDTEENFSSTEYKEQLLAISKFHTKLPSFQTFNVSRAYLFVSQPLLSVWDFLWGFPPFLPDECSSSTWPLLWSRGPINWTVLANGDTWNSQGNWEF